MAIKVSREQLEGIKRHGEETYPHECCGFLLGTSDGNANELRELYRAQNEWQDADKPKLADGRRESRENRYLITPEQWKRADDYARERSIGIIGYYHSHPDHPARPSGFDLDHSCWPGESYIIVSIQHGKAEALNSFTKPDYTQFEQEEIIVGE
ncbi:MAG TPA: M67 family metallopeptidase [Blastocatellia bacterium]|jgi:proteasome lid subunit RPN8/RPN11|nr:M67 family metallopeptidase [Blastocatellia bacterium]